MASMIDASAYYGEKEFADVTIKFGDREIECHKLILCWGSEYFKKLCGPGSAFVVCRIGLKLQSQKYTLTASRKPIRKSSSSRTTVLVQ